MFLFSEWGPPLSAEDFELGNIYIMSMRSCPFVYCKYTWKLDNIVQSINGILFTYTRRNMLKQRFICKD